MFAQLELSEMATESDPFVSGKEYMKPYDVTFTPADESIKVKGTRHGPFKSFPEL